MLKRLAVWAFMVLVMVGSTMAFPLDSYSLLVRFGADGKTVVAIDTAVRIEKYLSGPWAKIIVPYNEHVTIGKPLPEGAFPSG